MPVCRRHIKESLSSPFSNGERDMVKMMKEECVMTKDGQKIAIRPYIFLTQEKTGCYILVIVCSKGACNIPAIIQCRIATSAAFPDEEIMKAILD